MRFLFISETSKGVEAGTWDVVLALPDQAKELNKGLLIGTSGEESVISEEFLIPTTYHMDKIEIRNLVTATESMTIQSIKVTRIE